jgi:hypothetical protein
LPLRKAPQRTSESSMETWKRTMRFEMQS